MHFIHTHKMHCVKRCLIFETFYNSEFCQGNLVIVSIECLISVTTTGLGNLNIIHSLTIMKCKMCLC